MATITLYDETTLGEKLRGLTLVLPTQRITARELIRQRIDREVNDYNQNQSEPFQGLVQPSDSERLLNGYKLRTARKIDRDKQFELAIAAFENNGFILLVNNIQVEDLDVELELDDDSLAEPLGTRIVSFLKLVPLVGG
jgi:hypothetical protein